MTDRPFVEIYDTTLRDGTQQEGISLTAGDKLEIARLLDELGVAFVEGGWPGANPKDDEFFERAKTELTMDHAKLVAFGSTRRAKQRAEDDEQLAALLAAGTDYICLVGKSWDYHVEHALRTSRKEAIAMVADSVELLVACPPPVTVAAIKSWIGSQMGRSGEAATVGDYIFHAVKKLYQMVEYELVQREVMARLGR